MKKLIYVALLMLFMAPIGSMAQEKGTVEIGLSGGVRFFPEGKGNILPNSFRTPSTDLAFKVRTYVAQDFYWQAQLSYDIHESESTNHATNGSIFTSKERQNGSISIGVGGKPWSYKGFYLFGDANFGIGFVSGYYTLLTNNPKIPSEVDQFQVNKMGVMLSANLGVGYQISNRVALELAYVPQFMPTVYHAHGIHVGVLMNF